MMLLFLLAAGCAFFPPDHIWNARVDRLPVDPQSDAWVATVGPERTLRADLSIPWVKVPGDQPRVPIAFEYADESDAGPYPLPPDIPIEGGPASSGDRHAIALDDDRSLLYQAFSSYRNADASWRAV